MIRALKHTPVDILAGTCEPIDRFHIHNSLSGRIGRKNDPYPCPLLMPELGIKRDRLKRSTPYNIRCKEYEKTYDNPIFHIGPSPVKRVRAIPS